MSSSYEQQLGLIRNEYDCAKFALNDVNINWQRHVLDAEDLAVSPVKIRHTINHFDVSYILRLFATFEGLSKEYIKDYHPEVRLPADESKMKIGWYIDRVAQLQSPQISKKLQSRVFEVRACRNDLLHTGRASAPSRNFDEALKDLSKYLSYLPQPRNEFYVVDRFSVIGRLSRSYLAHFNKTLL